MTRLLICLIVWLSIGSAVLALDNKWDPVGASTDGGVDANWSLGHIPESGETAVVDGVGAVNGQGDNNCTMSTALTCSGITSVVAYDGNISLGTAAITLGSAGLVCAHSGNLTLTSGKLSVTDANVDWSAITGTFDDNNGEIEFNGDCTFNFDGQDVYDLTVSADATATATGDPGDAENTCTVNGKLDIVDQLMESRGNCVTTIGANGEIAGTTGSRFQVNTPNAGKGITQNSGVITCDDLWFVNPNTSAQLAPGTYSCDSEVRVRATIDATWTVSTGTYTINCELQFNPTSSGVDLTIDNGNGADFDIYDMEFLIPSGATVTVTNSGVSDWNISGHVEDNNAGTLIWGRGTGTITADGSSVGNEEWDWPTNWTVEDTVINKSSGGVKLTGNYRCVSMTVTDGDFQDGPVQLYTINNFTWTSSDTLILKNTPDINGVVSLTAGTGALTVEVPWDGDIPAGTYNATPFKVRNTKAGDVSYIFNGNMTFLNGLEIENTGAGNLTIDNSVNNPDLTMYGMTIDRQAGTITWTAGTGTVTWK